MTTKTGAAVAALAVALAAHGIWLLAGHSFTGPVTVAIFVAMLGLVLTGARFRWYNAAFRILLGLELIGSVADRFGLFGGPGTDGVSWGSFAAFVDYVRELLPSWVDPAAPVFAVCATVAELSLGALLIAGMFRAVVTGLAAVLLGSFALAMLSSVGLDQTAAYAVVAQSLALALLCVRYATGSRPAPVPEPVAAADR